MKKYTEIQIEIVVLQVQDIVRTSNGFPGGDHGFGDPNPPSSSSSDFSS